MHLLDSLLATCGLSLQAKQKFSHMSPNMEKQMREKLKEHAGSHGRLHDLTYWSFTCHHGFKVKMSAMDVVYATAILENYSRCDVEDDEDEKENEENINTENDMDIKGNSNNNRRKSVGGGGDEEGSTPESSADSFLDRLEGFKFEQLGRDIKWITTSYARATCAHSSRWVRFVEQRLD